MEKQYGTSNGSSKRTHPVYWNTDRTSQSQAGASEPRLIVRFRTPAAIGENSRFVVMIMVLHNTVMALSDTPGTHA
jgi:hypothetical protein